MKTRRIMVVILFFAIILLVGCRPNCSHQIETIHGKNPTCEEKGTTDGKICSICQEIIVAQEEIPALGHTVVIDQAVEADCENTGLTAGSHCGVCNKVLLSQTEIPAHDHTAVKDEEVAPTCESTGLTEGSHCGVCNKVLVAQTVVPAKGHTVVTDAAVAPTCKSTGLTEGSHCSVCDKVLVAQTVVPAKGHTSVVDAAVAPTCESTGLTEGSHCGVCNEVLVAQTTVPAKGHSYSTTWSNDANQHWHVCACGDKKDVASHVSSGSATETEAEICTVCEYVITPTLEHVHSFVVKVENEDTLKKAATCVDNAIYYYSCHCNLVSEDLYYEKANSALGHTPVIDAAVEADCENTGLTAGSHCNVCSEVLVAQTTVLAKGHTSVVDAAVEADCENTGLTEGSHCSVCSKVLVAQTTVPAKGHSYSTTWSKNANQHWHACACGDKKDVAAHISSGAATETEPEVCTVCDYVITPELDHVHSFVVKVENEYTLKESATCVDNAIYYYSCRCNLVSEDLYYEKENTALGHTSVADAAVEADCENTGLTAGSHCSVCSEVLVAQTTTPAKGHTSMADAAVEADCENTGLTAGSHCSVCSKVLVAQTTTPAKGHTSAVDAAVEADCENTGLTAGSHCSVCSKVLVVQTTVPAKGHTSVADAAVEADCENTGLTAGSHCSVCSKVLVAQTTVPAKGHTSAVDAAVEADCENTGLTAGSHCSVCSKVLVAQTTVPAKGHSHEVTSTVAATCTKDGSATYVCPDCSDTYTEKTENALGHKLTLQGVVEVSCVQRGFTGSGNCSRCSYTQENKMINPTGHKYENNICTVCSYNLNPSEGLEFILVNGNYSLAGLGTCTDTSIVVPANYKGKNVTSVASEAFLNVNLNGKGIYFPSTIKSIGSSAFESSEIRYVYFEEGVESINKKAFTNCFCEFVNIPSTVKNIGSYAFQGAIKSIILDSQEIANQAESYDAVGYLFHTTGTVIANSYIEVYGYEISSRTYCDDISFLGNEYKLYAYNTSVHVHDFVGFDYFGFDTLLCTSGSELVDYEDVTYDVSATENDNVTASIYKENGEIILKLSGTGDVINLNNPKWSSYNRAFDQVIIEEGITSIPKYAFRNTKISNITIPNTVKVINNYAFSNCAITSIDIPANVTSISSQTFYGCSKLESVNVASSNTAYKSEDGVLFTKDNKTLVLYPQGKKGTDYTVPDWVETIGDSSFSNNKNITNVTIPNTIKKIGTGAFNYCDGIKTMYIPSSIETISGTIFTNASILVLTSHTSKPSGWASTCFQSNQLVIYNVLESGVTEDELVWIKDSTGIKIVGYVGTSEEVTIPAKINDIDVLEIYNEAFKSNLVIKRVNITVGITTICQSAFYGCSNLEYIFLPHSITKIGSRAFTNCSKLDEVTLPNLTRIEENTFYGTAIREITIPTTVKYIGAEAFYNCSKLQTAFIPSNVTSIGSYAFYTSGMTIYTDLASKPSTWNSAAFYSNAIYHYNIDFTSIVKVDYTYYELNTTNSTATVFRYVGKEETILVPETITYNGTKYVVDTIREYAYHRVPTAKEIVVSNNVIEVEANGFHTLVNLENIFIPLNVVSMASGALNIPAKAYVYCQASSIPAGWSSSFCTNGKVIYGFTNEEIEYTFINGSTTEKVTSKLNIPLKTLVADDKYFIGWYDNESCSGNPVSSPYYSSTKTTLYAKWLTPEEAASYFDGSTLNKAKPLTSYNPFTASIGSSGMYFSFTVSETAIYEISSSGSDDADCRLYDDTKTIINSDDDGGTKYNFSLSQELTAGKMYYLYIGSHEGADTFDVYIEKN